MVGGYIIAYVTWRSRFNIFISKTAFCLWLRDFFFANVIAKIRKYGGNAFDGWSVLDMAGEIGLVLSRSSIICTTTYAKTIASRPICDRLSVPLNCRRVVEVAVSE